MKKTLLLLLLCGCALSSVAQTVVDMRTLENDYKTAQKLLQKGDKRQALELFERVRTYNFISSSDYEYSVLLDNIALIKCELGEVDQAIALEDEVITWRRTHKCDLGVVGTALSKKAIFYSYQKDYNAAIQFAEEASALLLERYGEKDQNYCKNLQNLAKYYSLRGASPQDYLKAVDYGERAVKYLDKTTPAYAYALNNLVLYYTQAENQEKANEYAEKAIQKGRSIFGKRSRAFADILAQQAVRLASLRNYSQAIDYGMEARNLYEADSAVTEIRYARILGQLGSFCKQAERFDMGIEALTRAQQVYQANQSEGTQEYINCISNLAALYRLKGDLEKADEIAQQTEQLFNDVQGDGNYLEFGKSLSEQARLYAENGDFRHAVEGERRALKVFTENNDTLNMAQSMNDLSSYCFNAGRHDEALQLCQQSIDLLRDAKIPTTVLGRAYNNLSLYNHRLGNLSRALELSRAAVRNYEEMGDVDGSRYSKILGNLAMFYYLNDSIDMAVNISRRSLAIQEKTLGNEHPDLVSTYYNLANYYYAKGEKDKMREYFEHAMEMQMSDVRNNFSHLTTGGRELYWNTKNYVFKMAPVLASREREDEALVGDAYNSLLFTKGILLNSEIDFENFLMRTGKTELLSKYQEMEQLRRRIDDYRRSAASNPEEISRLERMAISLERDVMRDCKEFGDFTSNLSISFKQVADSLAADAAAVEFVDTPTESGDRLYSALCLRHGWEHPRLIPLFTQDELARQDYDGRDFYTALKSPQGINAIYNNPQVGHLVWYPLFEALGADAHTIYFSPTGILHQLGIEYLKYNMEQRINERYEIHRVSSTKSIAQAKSHATPRSAAVFGGLEYDMDKEEMLAYHSHYHTPETLLAQNDAENTRALQASNAVALDSLLRAGLLVNPLPGTLVEAENVRTSLQGRGLDTHLYTEKDGTEEAFKSLSGRGVSLIHIATHGYLFSESDINKHSQLGRMMGQDNGELYDSDRSMERSVLFMAGANNILRNRHVPEGVEDGILTAREISQLDLRGLDLVVLSACQTGQGELKEDGVYGLQRAFKKAGAKTLVMSLWSVSDAATQKMMSSFYQALAAGQSRFEAFATAQQAVRDAGYADPYYWASFVMLDDNE